MKQRATQPALPDKPLSPSVPEPAAPNQPGQPAGPRPANEAASALSEMAAASIPRIDGDRAGLLAELRAQLPEDRLLVADDDLFAYECDGQTLDRARPLAVALPVSAAEVSAIVKACIRHRIPFVPRGAGTGLSGGAVAVGALSVSTARMNQIHEIDALNRQAWVGPGVVNAHLSKAVASHGLHYAPDPSSQNACTIGGNVAENSGGPHTLKYGVTTNHVFGLEAVLADGSIVTFGGVAADAPGYDFTSAFVGSEGTFGIATKILVRLTPNPEGVKTILAIFDSIPDACRGVTEILKRGILPAAIELIDQPTLRAVEAYIHAGFPVDAAAVLLVEVDGMGDDLQLQADQVVAACRATSARDVRLAKDDAERAKLWKGRKQAFGALGRLAPNYYTHDGVIPRTKLPEVLAEIQRIGEENQVIIANVFHAGDGNLHPVVLYDERVPGVIDRVKAAGDAILKLVLSVGGALSGEHGIGFEKIGYMGHIFDENDLAQMRRLRDVFNPHGLCNPGKVIPSPGLCVEPGAQRKLPLGH
jgi:glycolate oxidase